MVDDDELRAKLAKVEALFRGAGSPGERAAASAAMGWLQGRLGGSEGEREPEVELQFRLPDTWSVSRLQTELEFYFHDVTDHLVMHVTGLDGDDSGLDR